MGLVETHWQLGGNRVEYAEISVNVCFAHLWNAPAETLATSWKLLACGRPGKGYRDWTYTFRLLGGGCFCHLLGQARLRRVRPCRLPVPALVSSLLPSSLYTCSYVPQLSAFGEQIYTLTARRIYLIIFSRRCHIIPT